MPRASDRLIPLPLEPAGCLVAVFDGRSTDEATRVALAVEDGAEAVERVEEPAGFI